MYPLVPKQKQIRRVMNNAKTLASGAQNARFGLIVTNGVINAIDGKFTIKEMQELLKNESLIRDITTKVTSEVMSIPLDPWADQKKKIERFYKSNFGIDIDWSTVVLPQYDKNRPRLEYVHADFNCKRYIDAYKNKFKDESVAINTYSQDPDSDIQTQQERPQGNYCFAWAGNREPDTEHLGKSYDDFCNDGNHYMVPKEGIIIVSRERFESGKMLDVKGYTRFHALGPGGFALCMFRIHVFQFFVSNSLRDFRFSDYGPRQICF